MVAIFGGKWWLLVAWKNGGVGKSRFGTVFGVVLGVQNTDNNVWKIEYDEFFII